MNSQRAFQRRMCHDFLAHKQFYNSECVPFFKSVHPFTLTWISNSISPELSRLALRPQPLEISAAATPTIITPTKGKGSKKAKAAALKKNKKATSQQQLILPEVPQLVTTPSSSSSSPFFSDMREAIDSNGGSVKNAVGLAALNWLHNARVRSAASRNGTLVHQNYKFEVGQVVVHKTLGQLGVVADRLPICFETNDWIEAQLGSCNDHRMSEPWYLILVARHDTHPATSAMTRYGSEVSHELFEEKGSIGVHPLLPNFFKGFDTTTGRYIPRTNTELLRGCFTAPSISANALNTHGTPNAASKNPATVELRA